jgi:hypothetical protein
MKIKTDELFSDYYDSVKLKKRISDCSLTLIIPGFIIAAGAAVKAIAATGIAEKIFIAAVICAVIMILLGTIAPRRMIPVTEKMSAVLNKVGAGIIRIILIPVYILLFITSFLFVKSGRRSHRFSRWQTDPPTAETFFEKEHEDLINSKSGFGVIGSIVSAVSSHRMYFLLPVIFILILLGLLFFFVSSSTVFSFIYTFI